MTIRDTIDLLLLSAVWGASFLFMRIAGPELGPVALVALRVAIGTLFLLPVLMVRGDLTALRANWRTLAVIGAINSALPFVLLTYSTLYITGGFSAILNATAPMWAALIAWLWLADKLNAGQIAGLFVGFAGVWLLVSDSVGFQVTDASIAIMAAILGAFFYGVGANVTRKYAQNIKPLELATGSVMASAILLSPGAILTWPDQPVSMLAWLSVIVMGVASTGLAYILYFRLIRNVGPTNAITVTFLVPVFAMVLGAIFIDEVVTIPMVVGCVIVLLGTALVTGILKPRIPR